ncbi:hypothetical protein SNEBB_006879 [Seison nebaliae]|nr:hypothetical protein SNEBB_006879 [Seison nebaliae]
MNGKLENRFDVEERQYNRLKSKLREELNVNEELRRYIRCYISNLKIGKYEFEDEETESSDDEEEEIENDISKEPWYDYKWRKWRSFLDNMESEKESDEDKNSEHSDLELNLVEEDEISEHSENSDLELNLWEEDEETNDDYSKESDGIDESDNEDDEATESEEEKSNEKETDKLEKKRKKWENIKRMFENDIEKWTYPNQFPEHRSSSSLTSDTYEVNSESNSFNISQINNSNSNFSPTDNSVNSNLKSLIDEEHSENSSLWNEDATSSVNELEESFRRLFQHRNYNKSQIISISETNESSIFNKRYKELEYPSRNDQEMIKKQIEIWIADNIDDVNDKELLEDWEVYINYSDILNMESELVLEIYSKENRIEFERKEFLQFLLDYVRNEKFSLNNFNEREIHNIDNSTRVNVNDVSIDNRDTAWNLFKKSDFYRRFEGKIQGSYGRTSSSSNSILNFRSSRESSTVFPNTSYRVPDDDESRNETISIQWVFDSFTAYFCEL